jgi:hypothetical protein
MGKEITMTKKMIALSGTKFIDELIEALELDPDDVGRIIIDASAGDPVLVYITKYPGLNAFNGVSFSALKDAEIQNLDEL